MIDLSRLNEAQREAVECIEGPLLLLAGAGTGKTTVITYRMAYMLEQGIDPNFILALTFTNKAAREMKERVISLVGRKRGQQLTVGTFHSFGLSVMKKYIHRLGYDKNFTLADEGAQQRTMKQVLLELGLAEDPTINPGKALHFITNRKQQLEFADLIDADAQEEESAKFYRVWKLYNQFLKDQGMIDFDDLIVGVIRLFWEHPDVLEHYRERFKYLMVDEYQDTNLAQLELLSLLAGEVQNICAVGDDDQSIYGWRGADISNILEFEQHFRGTRVIRIEVNYRCSGNILAAANTVIRNNSQRYDKTLRTPSADGDKLFVTAVPSDEAEAELIAEYIKDKKSREKGVIYDDFAILYRSNSQSRLLEKAFKTHRIPYRLVSGTSFYSRAEIQDAIAYLKVLANPKDDSSLLRILNVPARGIGSKSIELLREMKALTGEPLSVLMARDSYQSQLSKTGQASLKELCACFDKFRKKLVIDHEPLFPGIREFLEECGYLNGLMKIYKKRKESEARRDNVHEFINDAAQYMRRQKEEGKPATLREYLLQFMLFEEEKESEEEGVHMLTVHSSKGLEFPYVMLVGLEQDQFPHEQSVIEGNVEEERRLFYVAVTRAKKTIVMTWCRERTVFGKVKKRYPSQFIEEMPATIVDHVKKETLIKPADESSLTDLFADFMDNY